ncbi:F0F1 ATP synthase subunit delta [Pontibacillus halophilus JSM 076056 = DSM 19796]|uniref:ATP synthase subunit delta n=1 Tax=Pontibacillus halophilus JSM 076056 = DSM 19796 TaxID=1385510 RepID=A0A0A5GKT8_9BACI|nr:F0F1 ATP synthase subunit delta [Pontibacillus halophilus]KGX93891.1 F0F1 ATP synthase subunit delta [Pontibacillus halophilus JSM 076056 = DSM 19796]
MSNVTAAKRYAGALFQLGQEKSKLEVFEQELREIQQVFNSNIELMNFLEHPRVELEKKKEIVTNAMGTVSVEVKNTINILLDRHREAIIPEMANQFFHLYNEAEGIAEATVYSVRELTEEEKKSISEQFAKRVNKSTLRIHNVVDSSIIGGIKLKIGNRIYDGSVSGKLERMERELVSANKR